jgi:DNA polymerase-3 subunit epsilon
VNLDALCRRFEIDNAARDLHGALLDCQLLAEVYLELCGGRQPGFELESARQAAAGGAASSSRPMRPARHHAPTPEETVAHDTLIEGIKDPIWRQ